MESSMLRKWTPVTALADPKASWCRPSVPPSPSSTPALIKNPVMFVVEIVSALTTILFVRDLVTGGGDPASRSRSSLWLWFTVLFANFAEAVAEGRGKAQADTLRQTRTETQAKLLLARTRRDIKLVAGTSLEGRRRRAGRSRRHHPVATAK